MPIFFWCILVLSSLDVILMIDTKAKGSEKVGDDPQCDYNEIVRDMIRSWEAPVVYLRNCGFLPSDYQDTSKIKASLDALMQRLDKNKREAKNNVGEDKRDQKIKGRSSVNKKKSTFAWEQLQAMSSKFTGSKGKLDEREAKLMAMKRRLEQLQCGAGCNPQLREPQMNVVPDSKPTNSSAQKYDDILQRMIEKTSPHSGRQPSLSFLSAKGRALTDNSHVASVPYGTVSLLTDSLNNSETDMPKSSQPEAKEGNGNWAASGLMVPKYLNWDMKNGRLDHYSSNEKEAYLNKLLQAYRPKETQKSWENSKGTSDFKHLLSQNL